MPPAIFCRADSLIKPFHTHPRVGLVNRGDLDIHVVAQRLSFFAIERKPVQHRQRIRRHGGAQPLNNVTVVIVVGWLD